MEIKTIIRKIIKKVKPSKMIDCTTILEYINKEVFLEIEDMTQSINQILVELNWYREKYKDSKYTYKAL